MIPGLIMRVKMSGIPNMRPVILDPVDEEVAWL